MPRTEPPEVQIDNAIITDFETLPYQFGTFAAWHGVQENRGRRLDQIPCPGHDHDGADEANARTNQTPTKIEARHKSGDCQDRRARVGQHVKVSSSKIMVRMVSVIVLMVRAALLFEVIVMM